jgi:hypothetical protein
VATGAALSSRLRLLSRTSADADICHMGLPIGGYRFARLVAVGQDRRSHRQFDRALVGQQSDNESARLNAGKRAILIGRLRFKPGRFL